MSSKTDSSLGIGNRAVCSGISLCVEKVMDCYFFDSLKHCNFIISSVPPCFCLRLSVSLMEKAQAIMGINIHHKREIAFIVVMSDGNGDGYFNHDDI